MWDTCKWELPLPGRSMGESNNTVLARVRCWSAMHLIESFLSICLIVVIHGWKEAEGCGGDSNKHSSPPDQLYSSP